MNLPWRLGIILYLSALLIFLFEAGEELGDGGSAAVILALGLIAILLMLVGALTSGTTPSGKT